MGFLRFLLAFSVVNVHAHLLGFNLIHADTAVQSFYIISGFYMAMVLNEKYNRPGVSYKDFILSRFFRIAPAYFFVFFSSVATGLVAWLVFEELIPPIQYWKIYFEGLSPRTLSMLVGIQFSILGLDITNFVTLTTNGGLHFTDQLSKQSVVWHLLFVPQGWTLALELYFYLLAPFIVRRSEKFIFGLMLASFALRLLMAFTYDARLDPWTYRFFPQEILFFLAGSLTYRLSKSDSSSNQRNQHVIRSVVFLMLVISGEVGRYGHKSAGILYYVGPILMGVLFLLIPKVFAKSKNNKFDRYLGELSYPIYVSHVLIIWIVELFTKTGSPSQRLLIGIASIATAILIYHLIDKKVDAFRHARFAKETRREI